jgi:hypothetical protein
MATLFAFGTFWFWALIVIAAIIFITITELEESSSWHWTVFLGLPVLLYFTGCADQINAMLTYAKDNPLTIVGFVLGYLFVGTIWSIIKWWLYLTNLRDYYREYKYSYNKDKFSASRNKERIINWMAYWPLSAIWTLINDPIKKGFKRIFAGLENRFQSISDNITKEFEKNDSK